MHSNTRFAFLNPHGLRLRRSSSGAVEALVGETVHSEVTARRLFPFSNPHRFLRILARDGKEIGVVNDPEALDQNSRHLLLEQVEKSHKVPAIHKINGIKHSEGMDEWDVQTDQGRKTILVKGGRDSVRVVGQRAIVTDVDSTRYEIPDRNALDGRSRSLIDQFV